MTQKKKFKCWKIPLDILSSNLPNITKLLYGVYFTFCQDDCSEVYEKLGEEIRFIEQIAYQEGIDIEGSPVCIINAKLASRILCLKTQSIHRHTRILVKEDWIRREYLVNCFWAVSIISEEKLKYKNEGLKNNILSLRK